MAPPPPPPSDEMTMGVDPALLVTPPQKHKTHGYGYSYTRDRRGTASSSPATSHASSGASPAQQLLKTRSAGEVLSPRLRGARMDPYPRYSPRKRLSADFSDGTYSADSGADSPKSEKGGWRIHAAVAGPFLTGPLAKDFTARLDELRSPRGKKSDEPDFDHSGLLLFPVVPDFVAPAITPEVFQASIQPAPAAQAQPQPEPDHSAVAPSNEACYYPPSNDQYYAQADASGDASWDAAAQTQQQSQEYYYADQQQQYSADEQQYSAEQAYYYNNGYDQYNGAAYSTGEYGYQQTYDQYPVVAEQPPVEAIEALSAEAFPPLPSHNVSSPEIDTPTQSAIDDSAASNQVAEVNNAMPAPASPVRRQRAPSYADVVTGTAHPTSATTEPEIPKVEEAPKKAAAKANFATFDQLSDGIAESMSRILAKSNGNKTHAEVEFSCLVHRIQTQLKLMGRVSNSLHLKQMKTMHKLQKSEIEKMSVESTNMELLTRVKKYEQEQEELKKQLAEALEAKDVRLKDAVDQLSSKIDSLKNSTDASTSTLASEIDAIRKCTNPNDLEKRVEEIGQVLDHLIENKSGATPAKRETRRHSVGSWKAIALYAIVVWAASLCGVWVGVKYAGTMHQTPTAHSVEQPVAAEAPVVSEAMSVLEPTSAQFEDIVDAEAATARDEIREVAVEIEQIPSIDFLESIEVPTATEEPTVAAEVVEEIAEVASEVSAPINLSEEELAPVQPTEFEAKSQVVFTFEQVAHPSSSCFTCPSGYSTMASFFCEMLSEVTSGSSLILAQESPSEPAVEVDSVESVALSDNLDSVVVSADDAVETIQEEMVAEEAAVSTENVVVSSVDDLSSSDIIDSMPVYQASKRPSTGNLMSSPLAHALYVWCPSLFDMHAEEEDTTSRPLSDLARALTSLSSQILSDYVPASVEVVSEEPEVATFEVIEETEESAVGRSPTAVEVESADEVAQITADVEIGENVEVVENGANPEDVEVNVVTENVSDVEDVDVTADALSTVDETVEVVAEEETASSRWATEQFFINVGILSGTAEIAAPSVLVENDETVPEWSLTEEPAASFVEEAKFVNSSTAEIVPALPAMEIPVIDEVAPVEVVAAVVDTVEELSPVTVNAAAPAVEEPISSCSLERCPLIEESVAEETKFTNASLVSTKPVFQIAEDLTAGDEGITETIGFSPVLDLKSVLLNSL